MSAPKTKIFVGHIPDGCTSGGLQALFERYGTVTECDVINKYGFVHMSTPEEADEAIKKLNNYQYMGSFLSVEHSKSKFHPQPGAPGRASGNTPRRGGQNQTSNGFGPNQGGGFSGSYSDGFRQFEAPPYGGPGGDYYGDRPFGYNQDRFRPYPPPFERRTMSVPPTRDDYPRYPPPAGGRDPYAPPAGARDPYPPPPGTRDPYPPPAGPMDSYPPPPGPRDSYPPPPAGTRDPYPPPPGAREPYPPPHPMPPPMESQGELYDRRPVPERTDYLYSRRSPPSSVPNNSFWYESTVGDRSWAPPPSAAVRRPPYF